jgi:uncharacterized protein
LPQPSLSALHLFGSALRGDNVAGSDLAPLGLEVDVLTPNGLPASFRVQVLRDAVPM